MEVKFDMVRIGVIRKNSISEKILRENVDSLKYSIQSLLKDEKVDNKHNQINMTMIIPSKGYNIKIVLEDIKHEYLRKELKLNFPNSIYNGKYSEIMDNLDNKIFGDY